MGDIPRLVPRGAGLHRLQDTRESPTKAPPAAQALKRAAPRAAEASRAGVERPVSLTHESQPDVRLKANAGCQSCKTLRARVAELEAQLAVAPQPKGFDRKAYQRELMRKRRAAGKA